MAPPVVNREKRRPWGWPERVGYWVYGFFLGPFLKKYPDGSVVGEMTYWAVAAFTIVEIMRLVPRVRPDGVWVVPPVSWQEVFMVFFILYAVPIDGGLTRAKPSEIVDLVGRPFSAVGDALADGAAVTTTLKQEVTPEPLGVSGDQR